MQVLIEHQDGVTGPELEREMFILRKLIERVRTLSELLSPYGCFSHCRAWNYKLSMSSVIACIGAGFVPKHGGVACYRRRRRGRAADQQMLSL